ncbi:OPT family oligopeptide transporter [Brachyspira alvinipulli]|uniref:OPT family oligopeptide transporter n=1 Tax=Brachyspira alvinipulli TaxID=84379 RepID=UPI0004B35E44|nr:oligopeptide transporter, OPT family [Brachyspira alvinipulli]
MSEKSKLNNRDETSLAGKEKKLSKYAYGGIKGEDYMPFVPSNINMPEMTVYSIILGVVFAIIFASANTYLGLKVGLTISSGIPGAILSIAIFKNLFKRNNILESNLTSALSASGQSIAAGVIFILPAVILFGMDLSVLTIVTITALAALMGCYFITPIRRYLIVEEHGKLIYPEAMAQSEVLVIGTEGGKGLKYVLTGLFSGFVYKLLSGGFGFWKEKASYVIHSYQNTMIGVDTLVSLLGLGFIIGIRSSAIMFAGGVMSWLVFIPLIKYFGSNLDVVIFPSKSLISNMTAQEIWSSYIVYIGAGALAMGGFISLGKSVPTIISSLAKSIKNINNNSYNIDRINRDAPIRMILLAAVIGFVGTCFLPTIKGGVLGGLSAVLFSFFFAVVSASIVGIVGASNNPVSGMTIAALLIVASIFKLTGYIGESGIKAALLVCGVVSISTSASGGTTQSLKSAFIIGGTPKNIQLGVVISLIAASFASGATLILMQNVYGLGTDSVPAPQGVLMKLIVEGIMSSQLPWTLVVIGAFIAVFCSMTDLPVLAIALGLYLNISLTASIFIGALIRKLVEYKFRNDNNSNEKAIKKGILLSSGLVAGDSITGVIIALITAFNIKINFGEKIFDFGSSLSFIMYILFAVFMYLYTVKKSRDNQYE